MSHALRVSTVERGLFLLGVAVVVENRPYGCPVSFILPIHLSVSLAYYASSCNKHIHAVGLDYAVGFSMDGSRPASFFSALSSSRGGSGPSGSRRAARW